jgi:argininosuccinate lyase
MEETMRTMEEMVRMMEGMTRTMKIKPKNVAKSTSDHSCTIER